MMADAIRNFPQQFLYKPEVIGELDHSRFSRFVVCGMGGSHLAADILMRLRPDVYVLVYSDYGVPQIFAPEKTLIILSSYSGNTEEVLLAAQQVVDRGLSAIAIAVGGKLLSFAQTNNIPYIQLPDTGVQPRSALGFSLLALAKAVGAEDVIAGAKELAEELSVDKLENAGKLLAQRLVGRVPIIYASRQNFSVAYNWKIKFNETGKVPAFYNVLPELNHNEMNGFDVSESTRSLSANFYFIFLRDDADHPQIQKRFEILKKLYTDRGLTVEEVPLVGETLAEKIFSSLVLADWTAVHTAEQYGLESEQVPMVEEFKRLVG